MQHTVLWTRLQDKEYIVNRIFYKAPLSRIFDTYTIFELLLIPFHILVYKNHMISYNESEEALGELQKIYEDMVESLEQLRLANKLTADEVTDILRVSAEMVDKVAGKCDKSERY